MNLQNQFYQFYRPYLKKICQSIKDGRVLLIVGINSIGKSLLTLQLQSKRFQKEFLRKKGIKLIFLEFKDKNPPLAEQLYQYWLTETAKALNYSLPPKEKVNDYSFYFHLSEMAKKLKNAERLAYIVLDAQNILNQNEVFYKSLIYLHRFTYRKITYIFLSEPQILESPNVWVQRFIQDSTNYKFLFLKLFDRKRSLVDIKREEGLLKTKLNKRQRSLVLKYSGGLHGVIGALCYFLKNNPQITNIRQLTKIVFSDKMYEYWIKDILDSIPVKARKILKEVINNGSFRHPLMLPILKDYSLKKDGKQRELKLLNNKFYTNGDKIKLTKKEFLVLRFLYKSKGKLVTFDQISETLWSDNQEKFSLWAISQIVRRLRKKFSLNFLNPKSIRSMRGEGYVLN